MWEEKAYAVYIMSNWTRGVLYVGVTSDLCGRVFQHREGLLDGFTRKYNCKRLVWFEIHSDIGEAIYREKKIKRWRRQWKIDLIERDNRTWLDLWDRVNGSVEGPRLV
jgi:putative endonuclease